MGLTFGVIFGPGQEKMNPQGLIIVMKIAEEADGFPVVETNRIV